MPSKTIAKFIEIRKLMGYEYEDVRDVSRKPTMYIQSSGSLYFTEGEMCEEDVPEFIRWLRRVYLDEEIPEEEKCEDQSYF